jgi:hypothetical protein
MVRDAVKRPLPKEAKSPGSVKKAEKANGGAAPAEAAADAQAEG